MSRIRGLSAAEQFDFGDSLIDLRETAKRLAEEASLRAGEDCDRAAKEEGLFGTLQARTKREEECAGAYGEVIRDLDQPLNRLCAYFMMAYQAGEPDVDEARAATGQ